ncbi:MAG: flagellar basal body P-ring formation protein FlgA [Gammaproteobacteria bacterium]|nr:flagellar basal body P-ring formation protein FlgA [Gammaproteobacteria bacterium]
MNTITSIVSLSPAGGLPRQAYGTKWQILAGGLPLLIVAALFPAMALATTPTGNTPQYQSLTSLHEVARDFLRSQIPLESGNSHEIHLGRLDSRLRLGFCEIGLQAFVPAGSRLQGKLTVGVQCPGGKPWTVYIPANIRVFGDVLTTSRPISRGDAITRADIISRRQEISTLNHGYYRQTEEIIGKLAMRSLPAGTPLTPRMLKARLLVRRGDDVTILANTGFLQVRSKGKALQNAAQGERITVRNTRSKRIIEGIAIKAGTVQVHM